MAESSASGPQPFSRSDFIRGVALAGLAGVNIWGALRTGQEPERDGEDRDIHEILTDEQKKAYEEIKAYREDLALPMPWYLTVPGIEMAGKVSWDRPAKKTKIEMSEAFKSHALKAMAIQELLFGENGSRLVNELRADEYFNTAGRFSSDGRTMLLDTIDDPNSEWFTYVSTHENAHAADPFLMYPIGYPLDTLIKVAHGSARVLSQATKIEGKYFRDPSFYNATGIRKKIGEGVGWLFLQDRNLTNETDVEGHRRIVAELASIALDQGVNMENIKFTKKACYELGSVLFPQILEKKVKIKGSLRNDWYTPGVEWAAMEIFAEVFSLTLVYPEEAQGNREIIEGIGEILSVIQGREVKVEDVMAKLGVKDKGVEARYNLEQQALKTEEVLEEDSGEELLLNPSEVKEIAAEADRQERTQDTFWGFILWGDVPANIGMGSSEIKDTMKRYAGVISTAYNRHPEIINGLLVDDMSFDPPLHLWETHKLAEAFNVDVVYNLLNDPTLIPANLEDVERRIKVLTEFIESPAFEYTAPPVEAAARLTHEEMRKKGILRALA
ncbi:MAG TPA: hypothetical protein VJ227_02715 [Patescibacteria group bacterium]|nr:hypothetical protein [Patescibacteria group bacterium]